MDNLEKQICRFFNAQHEINMAYEDFAKQNGMTYNCIQVMHLIYNNPGCTQKTLNEWTMLPKQTINSLVTNMYSDSLVELRQTPEDRRCKAIYYSEKGQEAADDIFSSLRDLVRQAMQGLDDSERTVLIDVMEKFAELMKKGM